MSVYTKNGDGGKTMLFGGVAVDKWDERIVVNGAIDELNASLGLLKSLLTDAETRGDITRIQEKLMALMAAVAGYKCGGTYGDETKWLEGKIDGYEKILPKQTGFIIYGDCRLSAAAHVARAVARRCETGFARLAAGNATLREAAAFLNRLSDYLFVLARYLDFEHCVQNAVLKEIGAKKMAGGQTAAAESLNLFHAKKLIEEIERKAAGMGLNAVIAVCNAYGNPVAVHVMDNAFLISYDVALAKAYTAASVKMTTAQLGKLAQPGQMFYGLEDCGIKVPDGGKIAIIGGGVPLFGKNGALHGGLGVSGGTAEEDTALADYGLSVYGGGTV